MGTEGAIQFVENQQWLEPAETTLQKRVHDAFPGDAGRRAKDFLHGTWLGHPLHPALTDVPLGAWTVAAVLDLVDAIEGDDRNAAGSEAAVTIGIAGAVAAAATGLTDWSETDGPMRRLGLVHGSLNTVALGLYVTSLVKRRQGKNCSGRWLGWLGYLTSGISAYLGGHLVYRQQIGVNHAPMGDPPDFTPVIEESALEEGKLTRAKAGEVSVLLVKRGQRIYAIDETCSHLGGPLSQGTLEGDSVVCPWHGSRFALAGGAVLNGPSTHPQPCFETRVRDGKIEVRAVR
jgi:nitrite reductase/ring-hydroxylating ferredoxin subunit/uncharacterized membrane protein